MSITDDAVFRVPAQPSQTKLTVVQGGISSLGNRILQPGRNCWKTARAEKVSVLVDGNQYFKALDAALGQARESIIIIGWDFDGRIRLNHEDPESMLLSDRLRSLVEENEQLSIHILIWSESVIHAGGSSMEKIFGAEWQNHPRIRIKLDTYHPKYAAHHQKIVCVDDCLAFVGGIDLTIGRWDRSPHQYDEPKRLDPDGKPYHPVHDIQMLVDGDAARAVSMVAKARWEVAIGDAIPDASCEKSTWPDQVPIDFTDVEIGVARTVPEYGGMNEVDEVIKLTLDALNSARDCIYIEAQYMTASEIGDVLVNQLQKAAGPEVVIVMTHKCEGFMEHWIMGANRDRLMRRLKKADIHGRLRVLYPCIVHEGEGHQVFVHSKLIVVDDRFLRIGSSNLNNRSIGLDTECDLGLEASDKSTGRKILDIRDRLIAEHLGVEPSAFTREVERYGSLIKALDARNGNGHQLREFEAMHDDEGSTDPLPGTRFFDPKRPFKILRMLDWRRPARESGN